MNRQLYLFLILVVVLVGCQREAEVAPTAEQPLVETTASITPAAAGDSAAAYPAGDDAYPAPEAFSQRLTPAYPGAAVVDPNTIITRAPDSALDPDRPVPTPEAGMAAVTGYVLSETGDSPYVDIPVRLAQVFYNEENIGSFILDGAQSPGALTDVNGRFVLAAVEPGEYVLVVGNVETGNYDIIESSDGNTAQVWEVSADEITDVGTLRVELPVP